MRMRNLSFILLLATVATPVVMSGCSARAGYTTYDPYYNDYHRWDPDEVTFYSRWEVDTHRDHRDFDKRSDDEKKEYWTWRHGQPDHGNGHRDQGNGHGH